MDNLISSMKISGTGMDVQSQRIRVTSENIANANSTGNSPGADPYAKKEIIFTELLDSEGNSQGVKVKEITQDNDNFDLKYDPSHPAANADGYVKTPNVNTLIEMANTKSAQRAYDANLSLYQSSREMVAKTIDLLK